MCYGISFNDNNIRNYKELNRLSLLQYHVIKNVIDQFSYYRRYFGIYYIFVSHRVKQEINKYNSISITVAFPFKFS